MSLTYRPESLGSWSLQYGDYQNFMRRARRSFPGVRFFAAGEYGEDLGRPHFHALLFGCSFQDRQFFKDMPSGFRLYTSPKLEQLWPHGFSSVGDVTFESAAYVARYVCKKITGAAAAAHYLEGGDLDSYSGELVPRRPEFARMSLKPGIGAKWYERFGHEVHGLEDFRIHGVRLSPPKYYDKLFQKFDPAGYEDIQFQRYVEAQAPAYFGENSPARLAVHEAVTKARLSFKKRTLK